MFADQLATAAAVERAAASVGTHPWVAEVTVEAGSLRVRPAPSTMALRPEPGPLLREYLESWAEVYDLVYEQGQGRHADDLDLSGWRASDTGAPFPTDHMVEWVDRTVELVLRGRPRVVLELGCGSGLLLHRLRRQVSGYLGTDVSPAAVARLSAARLPGVAVVQAAAHETGAPVVRRALARLAGPDARPDCVLLNSVTQHFPNVDYLATVVRDAIALVAPGGTVVVGDARHVGLLDRYCRALESVADPDADPAELARRAAGRAAREEELLLDPRLLARIAADSGRSVSVTVHAKTMREPTELTRYRFDAVLQVDPPARPGELTRRSWWELPPDRLGALRARATGGDPLLVDQIPNALLVPDGRSDPGAISAAALHEALTGLDAAVCLDLADPAALAVGVPAWAASVPARTVPVPERAGLAHEPLARFVSRRLAEVLHDHLRRTDPAQADVEIQVG